MLRTYDNLGSKTSLGQPDGSEAMQLQQGSMTATGLHDASKAEKRPQGRVAGARQDDNNDGSMTAPDATPYSNMAETIAAQQTWAVGKQQGSKLDERYRELHKLTVCCI